MANYFLQGAKGTMVMEDLLVDLDPDRQARAAEILKSYGRDKKIIVFAYHPSHAELPAGHRVEL